AGQRAGIIALAKAIRNPPPPPKPPAGAHSGTVVTSGGVLTLQDLAAAAGTKPAHILHLTVDFFGGFPAETAAWVNAVFTGQADPAGPMPAGMHLRVPVAP